MPKQGKANAVPRTVMIYPDQWATVGALAEDMGYPSMSSALRRIIDEWAELKRRQLVDSPAPYEATAASGAGTGHPSSSDGPESPAPLVGEVGGQSAN